MEQQLGGEATTLFIQIGEVQQSVLEKRALKGLQRRAEQVREGIWGEMSMITSLAHKITIS